jgi:hypothetical protein
VLLQLSDSSFVSRRKVDSDACCGFFDHALTLP